jgi:asparagine synthase (glutamine-hydrolysing)
MCGIVGVWDRTGASVDEEVVREMRDRMLSRGPDDAGLWRDGSVCLGQRRLSIIDLSPAGHQPMIDEVTGNAITFNGEIYNFRELRKELVARGISFHGSSDTEVLLKAYRHWGRECVTRFIGMFAFAIWDARARAFWLVRDRIGIKPLYYHVSDRTLLFASRLKALLAHPACPRSIDVTAQSLYLEAGYVPAPWSILEDVRKLEPGHSLWVDSNGARDTCYWNIDELAIDPALESASDAELTERLDRHLRDAVEARLVSDVPLGAFLSGGIDSSTVVAIMADIGRKPDTFTIGFDEERYSELADARKIADHLGTEHHERIMRSRDLLGLLDDISEHYDEPFADWSSLPTTMVSRFAREHVTVALSGDGGDELFAGYEQYRILEGIRPAFRLPRPARSLLAAGVGCLPGHRFALLAQCIRRDSPARAFTFIRSMIKDFDRSRLIQDDSLPSLAELFDERRKRFAELDDISSACRVDTAYYLPDDILQKVDVASMSTSLEARVPILDHRVIEFSQSLPLRFKRRHGQGKWLLRQVLARYVPPELTERPKTGFGVPIREWFRGDLREMVLDELAPARIREVGFLDPAGVNDVVQLHLSGRRDTHPVIGTLLSLLRWHRQLAENW